MTRLLDRNIAAEVELTGTRGEGHEFVYDQADDRTVFVAVGTGKITVEARGPQGTSDMVITLPGSLNVFTLDSYFFKGKDGKVKITATEGDITVGVIALP